MTRVTAGQRNLAFTWAAHAVCMTKNENTVPDVDPGQVLESVVSELENLLNAVPLGAQGPLVELHGALLVYNLEGHVELLPDASFGMSPRRWKERRVLRAARLIGRRGQGDADLIVRIASQIIETNLHLIDPELQWFAC